MCNKIEPFFITGIRILDPTVHRLDKIWTKADTDLVTFAFFFFLDVLSVKHRRGDAYER